MNCGTSTHHLEPSLVNVLYDKYYYLFFGQKIISLKVLYGKVYYNGALSTFLAGVTSLCMGARTQICYHKHTKLNAWLTILEEQICSWYAHYIKKTKLVWF